MGDRIFKISGPDGNLIDVTHLKSSKIVPLLKRKLGTEMGLEIMPAGKEEHRVYGLTLGPKLNVYSHAAAVSGVAFSRNSCVAGLGLLRPDSQALGCRQRPRTPYVFPDLPGKWGDCQREQQRGLQPGRPLAGFGD